MLQIRDQLQCDLHHLKKIIPVPDVIPLVKVVCPICFRVEHLLEEGVLSPIK